MGNHETDYFEPSYLLYDWRDAQESFSDEQARFFYEKEGDIQAYMGYPDVQLDIARTAVAKLVKLQNETEQVSTVVDLRQRLNAEKIRTVYGVVASNPVTHKPFPLQQQAQRLTDNR
jgi:hypothetical protein